MNKLLKYCQTGGNGIIAEAGEFYKDENGQIHQINPNTVTHDDYILIDGQGNPISKMPYNQGGVAINRVQNVLSASHENRESNDASYKQADEDIRIKPKEGKEFAKRFNFDNIKFSGGSPSKLFDSVLEAKTKKLKKYNNIEYNENSPYGINSSKANGDYVESLPQDEMIYDEIFDYQENKKQEKYDDLANYKNLEVYQLGGNSKVLWQTGRETNYVQDGKDNINNGYPNKNKSILFNNNNLVGSKNKGLDREVNQSYSKLQQDLLNQEKQKQEFEKNQTFLSEYKPLNPNLRKIFERQKAQDEFKRKVFTPIVKGLDIATDIGSMGNFIPIPQAQAIGKFSNILGAGVDLYQSADALKGGDYENALINASSLAIPYAIENPKILGSFKRTNKWIDGGNFANKYGRTTYLNVDKRYKGMKHKELSGNRALLGTLASETAYDTQQTGGKGALSPYPEMYGSKPVAMVSIKGKLYPATTVNGKTVSMDDMFNKRDSVELKNFKAIKLNKNERIKK